MSDQPSHAPTPEAPLIEHAGADTQALDALGLAAAMNVSRQAVHNWRREGMPAREQRIGRRVLYAYDLAACTAWHAQHKADPIAGGKRPGSGRPSAHDTTAQNASPLLDQTKAELDRQLESLKQYTSANEILQAVRSGELSRVDADTIRIGVQAAIAAIELEKFKGSLIALDHARRAIRMALGRVREIADQLPHELAELCAAQAPGVSRHAVRLAVEKALDRAWSQSARTGALELSAAREDGA